MLVLVVPGSGESGVTKETRLFFFDSFPVSGMTGKLVNKQAAPEVEALMQLGPRSAAAPGFAQRRNT